MREIRNELAVEIEILVIVTGFHVRDEPAIPFVFSGEAPQVLGCPACCRRDCIVSQLFPGKLPIPAPEAKQKALVVDEAGSQLLGAVLVRGDSGHNVFYGFLRREGQKGQ